MIGYKIIEKNTLKSDYEEMTFELGKEYKAKDIPDYPGIEDFCFYKTLVDASAHNNLTGDAIFEVDTLDSKITDSKYVKNWSFSDKIKIIREVPNDEIEKYIKSNIEDISNNGTIYAKSFLVKEGYCLDKFISDDAWQVRKAVALQNYGLEKLAKDKDYRVRITVINQGYIIDEMINDPNSRVRAALAINGKYLDILVNDNDKIVARIAKEKRELNKED